MTMETIEFVQLKDECQIPSCSRNVYSKSFCNLHYQRNRKLLAKGVKPSRFWIQWFEEMNEPPAIKRLNPEGKWYHCSEQSCSNSVHAKGLCAKHYIKRRRE